MVKKRRDILKRALFLVAAVPLYYSIFVFGCQVVVWLRAGTWVPLPATYLFASPAEDCKPPQLAAEPTTEEFLFGPTPDADSKEPAAGSHTLSARPDAHAAALNQLLAVVPSRLRSRGSWLSCPESWLGLHKVVSGALGTLSVPGLALILWVPLAIYVGGKSGNSSESSENGRDAI